ncbi:HEAT repeat domain-containing protein [Roseateles amylovorans]|uniref:HEAT repeat domain-containing protein n=1 Tax=Roseateles amylovorans TaxID=2978473 RepID=A0ABY6AWT1_9BURK|nr:HEAT repeat domain-containing protein [Roseateles amylovorans]UXH76768.1 HEAT repeat domain-containing protein [Roseateles amylovorans]
MGLIKSTAAPARDGLNTRTKCRDCEGLQLQLDDERPEVRRLAARDLGERGDCPAAAPALLQRLAHEPRMDVREALLHALVQLKAPEAAAGLVDCLRQGDTALRNQAIEALRQWPDEALPLMRQLLADDDAHLRIHAVRVLEGLGLPEVAGLLARALVSETHVNVCASLLESLSQIGDAQAVEAIEAARRRFDDQPYIDFAARAALQRCTSVTTP